MQIFGGVFTIYIIANPISGHGCGQKTGEKIQQKLENRHIDFQIHYTQYPGHASKLARDLCARDDCQSLCGVGGDGTFYEILSGLDPRIPLCLVPAGTGNDFVHGAGLETDPMKAVDYLLSGISYPYDYLQVNDMRCLNGAGLGFDISVLENEHRFRKFIHGKASYYFALIQSIFCFGGRQGHVVLDDKMELDVNLFQLSAMNGKYIGGGMPISPASQANDGMMDVVVIKMMPRRALPKLLFKYLNGRLQEETKYVSTYHCSHVRCQVSPSSRVQLDGEIQDIMPVDIRLVPGGIRLFGKVA